MPSPDANSYDTMPYGNAVFTATHPDRLATVAILNGLTPPSLEGCQVLELGCACGGNLLPMAVSLPECRFVGIDLSQNQVAAGRAVIEALGLDNVELHHRSITDIGADFGTFDYIICHGVYSWVPPAVQEQILRICRANLAANGVGYVSYNTYPGWHLRSLLRDLMTFHVRAVTDPHQRVRQARTFLDLLLESFPNPDTLYGQLLQREVAELRPSSDTYVFHEHLEEYNEALYFYQFIDRLAGHGLQYLGEAEVNPAEAKLLPEIQEKLQPFAADPVNLQQYLDFLIGRMFRRSLLCHAGQSLVSRAPLEAVQGLLATCNVRPVSERVDVASDAPESFRTAEDVTVTTNHPLFKGALTVLAEVWPRSLSFAGLWQRLRDCLGARLGKTPEAEIEGQKFLADVLLRSHLNDLIELHCFPPRFAHPPGDRPLASPLARYQVVHCEPRCVNLRHRPVEMPPFDRAVLVALDGTRDRPALVRQIVEWAMGGVVVIDQQGQPLRDPVLIENAVGEWLEPSLRRLANHAFLME